MNSSGWPGIGPGWLSVVEEQVHLGQELHLIQVLLILTIKSQPCLTTTPTTIPDNSCPTAAHLAGLGSYRAFVHTCEEAAAL